MFFKDFACSSKIKPAVVGSSKEFTTSLIAVMILKSSISAPL